MRGYSCCLSILRSARPGVAIGLVLFCFLAYPLIPLGPVCKAGGARWSLVETDWIKQAEAWKDPPKPAQTSEDARGAVDGIRNGKYGFHTGHETNPWWQVDL
ncbi:MAG: hypothetical protein ACYTFW_16370, partial [Planctomycetota bacterium]